MGPAAAEAGAVAGRAHRTPGGQGSVAERIRRIEAPLRGTALTVSERIRMFETKSTPCLQQPGGLLPGQPLGPGGTSGAVGEAAAVAAAASRSATPTSTAGGYGASSARGSGASGSAAAKSSSAVVPAQRQGAAPPKELQRSQSELRGGPRQAPQSARIWRPGSAAVDAVGASASRAPLGSSASAGRFTHVAATASSGTPSLAGPRGTDAKRSDARPLSNDLFERLAAGTRRNDIAKPQSLKAAEQGRVQEEQRQRERQEVDQGRARAAGIAGGAPVAAATSTIGATAVLMTADVASAGGNAATLAATAGAQAPPTLAAKSVPTPAPAQVQGEADRVHALALAPTSASQATTAPAPVQVPAPEERPAPEKPRDATERAATGAHAAGGRQNRQSNSVEDPQRAPEATASSAVGEAAAPPGPAALLRCLRLGPKRPEDNYEISEHGSDSEAEEAAEERDRSGKHVPKWCECYLEDLKVQSDVDPDTIFSSKVPQCVLEDIFTDAMYQQVGKTRPKRARGSSGDWRKDRLARQEIYDYKARMGQTRSWDAARPASAAEAAAGL